MPFDPKLIHNDDANFEGDLELPDDLALMAEQLGDDANRLAALYPPPSRTEHCSVPRKAAQRSSTLVARSLAGAALSAGLVTISLVAMNTSRQSNSEKPVPVGRLGVVDENGGTAAPSSRPAYAGRSPVMRESPFPAGQVPVTPASWLGDTSGPELEALMDLWEQDQPAVRSLSF